MGRPSLPIPDYLHQPGQALSASAPEYLTRGLTLGSFLTKNWRAAPLLPSGRHIALRGGIIQRAEQLSEAACTALREDRFAEASALAAVSQSFSSIAATGSRTSRCDST